jgi:flagellin-like protein
MRHIKRNLRAISPVLAVLMMIAVAIAGSLVTYAWVMGYIGFTTEKSGKAIMIQSVANKDSDLVVYVQNVGEGTVELDETSCLYVNGALVDCTITGVTVSAGTAIVGEGDTATLTYAGGAAAAGEKKTVKVASQLGTFSEKSTYPAEGTGGGGPVAPVLDHFTFDPISTPQTSGAAFSITITARDQYGAAFTSYTGTNTLSYSAGTISPTTTTAFTAGVWTGSVTVTGSGTGVTIGTSAQATPSITGTSNTFNVDAPAPQTITLRPNGDGTYTDLDEQGSGWEHYTKVDDTGSGDGDSTYVYKMSMGNDWTRDTYTTENTGVSGTINSITVYARCRDAQGDGQGRLAIRTNSQNFEEGDTNLNTGNWQLLSYTWNDNPATASAWTWSEINALEIGVELQESGYNYDMRCTQVYVEVTYTP